MVDLIARKRAGSALEPGEIRWWLEGYVREEIPDYQSAAMLMAIALRGMTPAETLAMTLAMAESGTMIDLSRVDGVTADKHSTGGVGDSTTLVTAPIAAACGLKVAKISGRGLGHTGGTIDKLESIPGFRTDLSPGEFVEQVNRVGIAVTGATADLAPADKLLYALRDVTATVNVMPLVASSVMSKKLAAGAGSIVLDVKTGAGAVTPEAEDAFALARQMVAIGESAGRRTRALVTSMDEPLGACVGNALDVAEAISILRGDVRGPLAELSLRLAGEMLVAAGLAPTTAEANRKAEAALASGYAVERFQAMVEAQGGDPRVADDPGRLPAAPRQVELRSEKSGYVGACAPVAVGTAAGLLGAGRGKKTDTIDPRVGVVLKHRVGDAVRAGDVLAVLHASEHSRVEEAVELLGAAFAVGPIPGKPAPLVLGAVPGSAEHGASEPRVL